MHGESCTKQNGRDSAGISKHYRGSMLYSLCLREFVYLYICIFMYIYIDMYTYLYVQTKYTQI